MVHPVELSLVIRSPSFILLAEELGMEVFTALPVYNGIKGELLAFVWTDHDACGKILDAAKRHDILDEDYHIAYLYEDRYNDYQLCLDSLGNSDLDILNVGVHTTLAYDVLQEPKLDGLDDS